MRHGDPCYSCGSVAETMDHVFPRSLYVRRPDPGLTVPACRACQLRTRPHEDYFRDFVAGTSYRHETARELWPRIRRSFRREPRRGRAFLEATRQVDVRSGGIFLGTVDALQGDRNQIDRALMKIVRGLWNIETADVMPADELKWNFAYASPLGQRLPEAVANAVRQLPIRYAGPEVAYRFAVHPEDGRVTLAWMDFYGTIMFAVSTSPTGGARIAAGHESPTLQAES